jgi:hypothetical protein
VGGDRLLGAALGQEPGELGLGHEPLAAVAPGGRQRTLALPSPEGLHPDAQHPRCLPDPHRITSHEATTIQGNLAKWSKKECDSDEVAESEPA